MILVIAAMQEEIKLFMHQETPQLRIKLSGVGKVNAAMVLAGFIATHPVEAIYNLGFAGATQPYEVGDLVLIQDALYHDFDLTLFGYEKGQVPGYPSFFESDQKLVDQIKKVVPDIKTGRLFTGDYFMTDEQENPCILDMEGAALYQVAYLKKIPIVSVKVISDVMGMNDHYQSYKKFESNVGAEILNQVFYKLFKEV
ncbi:MAG: 5'-methylthioadenosine/S-adenosylhomocysteine nucleosidase [Firmicutes bacterium]|nr:5'-methylthioadenosine/S-adenosylhomocysteine nucleosidase [Bacillota bacterium]